MREPICKTPAKHLSVLCLFSKTHTVVPAASLFMSSRPTLHLVCLVLLASVLPAHSFSPSPTCMMNGFPCPNPVNWSVDWSLYNSTAAMPELSGATNNLSFVPAPGHHWGMVSLDWAVGRGTWLNPGQLNKSTCVSTSAANCAALVESGKVKHCGIYANVELALEWMSYSREVMYDPAKAHYFLQYTDGLGNKNGTIYNAHRAEGDQYFIDYRVPEAAAYFVSSIVNATVFYNVSLTFTDDRDGVPVEHESLPGLLNLSSVEVQNLQFATQSAGQYLATSLAAVGKTCWDCLGGYNLGVRPTQGDCAIVMRDLCTPAAQGRSMFMGFSGGPDLNQTIAAFLVTRPPIAFLGSRWQDSSWNPLFNMDVGEPTGLCSETTPGVFERVWTKGVAALDCNTWVGDLPFGTLAL